MDSVKKLALVTCASNFERHGNFIRAMRQKLGRMDHYALYVVTNYGVYDDSMDFTHGGPAIYSLLKYMDLDGCILEANLGSNNLAENIAQIMRARGIPLLTINMQVQGVPYLHLETHSAGAELMNHLIRDHGCKRINLVLNEGNGVVSQDTKAIYRDVLEDNNLPFEEERVLTMSVSIPNGRLIYEQFDSRGVMRDADAVLCVHDVSAIGLILDLQERGIRVPEDLKVCSMNFSGNSVAFRPGITGVDRMDQKAAELALELMDQMVRGQEVPLENTYISTVACLESCGCSGARHRVAEGADIFQRLVINKIEAGNQVGRMMQFNDALEDVDSFSQLAENIHRMMDGIGCQSFFCCLNDSDPAYIESNQADPRSPSDPPYDERMRVIVGRSERTGVIANLSFDISRVVPVEPRAGDLFVLLPIHHIARDFGYMAFLNDLFPVSTYNYRICQDSIGSCIANLHRQMMLKYSIEELELLHMQDQMTGLYNRFALRRYAEDYLSSPSGYSVAMLDMDSLKNINDSLGHLAGNNAIVITANVIREAVREDDLVVRYGGDEFLILSHETRTCWWEECRTRILARLLEIGGQQRLPYQLRASMGYAISTGDQPLSLDRCIELADSAMYRDKQEHKRWL